MSRIIIALLISSSLFAQQIVINEIMTSNSNAYFDEFGDTPDWIELFNKSEEVINIENYSLTDNYSDLHKWTFPSINIAPNEILLVNLSGRDIKTNSKSWETIIRKGEYWKYFLGTQEPLSGWKDNTFNDIDWNIGFSGIGYGDDDDQTIIEPVNSIYLRKTFKIIDKTNISEILFNIDYDDGFVAYINGHEIARSNLGTKGMFVPFNMSADNAIEARLYQGIELESFYVENFEDLIVDGNNTLAIQIHNFDSNSSDLTAIPFLSIGYKQKTNDGTIADEIKTLLPSLHSNFGVENRVETIYLVNPNGNIEDSVFVELESDISFGRQPDGSTNWFYFNNSTPGNLNNQTGFLGQVENPQTDFAPGFYSSSITLHLTNNSNHATYYTFDGSEPSESSAKYTTGIYLFSTKVVKLKTIADNYLPSKTITLTYFINVEKSLPIVSISTNPYNLWDNDYGIYVMGPNAENSFPHFGANFWQDWSRPAHFEFFDQSNSAYLSNEVDIKIFGAWSKGYPQKSLAVFAKGNDRFNYKFFQNNSLESFSSIVMRNAGNDWNSTMLRDGFMETVAKDLNVDKLDYQPAVMYLNGEYWGIHDLREKINLDYFATHYNIKKDEIDLLELSGDVIDGENEEYLNLMNFLENNNLSLDANYDFVKSQIDIESFIDYMNFQIYIANTDWPGNNVKFWKPRIEDGKWRWILYDMDFGFSYIYSSQYKHNTLQFALEPNGPGYPNPPWSTLVFRKLIENKSFKIKFINRFSDLINTTLKSENVINILDETVERIKNEMPAHINKWQQFSYEDWEYNIDVMKEFANQRISNLKQFFSMQFSLSGSSICIIQNSNTNGGKVKINSLKIDSYPFLGNYFNGVPITVKAKANPDYIFKGWTGTVNSMDDSIVVDVNSTVNLIANFEKKNNFPEIIFNEINYNSNSGFDTEDWFELYNNSSNDIDLSNWIFKDSQDTNEFIFKIGTILKSNEYLVVCRDTADFKKYFNTIKNIYGNFDFGLSNSGDLLRLFSDQNEIIDSVRYDDVLPWDLEADGAGKTLELKNPELDNSLAQNWSSSQNNGTPGLQNSNFIVTKVEEENILPYNFELFQNYPNPFNPTTTIKYSIPQQKKIFNNSINVVLKVYDVLGRELKTLVNEKQKPGTYEVNFNSKGISSGVYFYKITAENFSATKKMIILK